MKQENALYLIKENSIINKEIRKDLITLGVDTDYALSLYDLITKIALNEPILVIIDGDKYQINEELLGIFSIKSPFFVPLVIIIGEQKYELPDPSFSNIISFNREFYIREIEDIIIDIIKKRIFYKNQIIYLLDRAENINSTLLQLGITPKHIGFCYLRDCIMELMNKDCMALSFDTALYPAVCSKHNTSRSCLERSLRTAIKQSWDAGHMSQYKINNRVAFESRPNIKEFVYTLAYNIKMYETKLKLAQLPNINSLFVKSV